MPPTIANTKTSMLRCKRERRRADGADLVAVQRASQSGDRAREREGRELGPGSHHAERLGSPDVVALGDEHPPAPSRPQPPRRHHAEHQRRQADEVEGPVAGDVEPAEQDRSLDGLPVLGQQPAEVAPVEHHPLDHRGQREGDGCEEQPGQPQRRDADQDRDTGADQRGQGEGDEEVGVVLRRKTTRDGSADAGDAELPERDLAGPTGEHGQRQRDHPGEDDQREEAEPSGGDGERDQRGEGEGEHAGRRGCPRRPAAAPAAGPGSAGSRPWSGSC